MLGLLSFVRIALLIFQNEKHIESYRQYLCTVSTGFRSLSQCTIIVCSSILINNQLFSESSITIFVKSYNTNMHETFIFLVHI